MPGSSWRVLFFRQLNSERADMRIFIILGSRMLGLVWISVRICISQRPKSMYLKFNSHNCVRGREGAISYRHGFRLRRWDPVVCDSKIQRADLKALPLLRKWRPQQAWALLFIWGIQEYIFSPWVHCSRWVGIADQRAEQRVWHAWNRPRPTEGALSHHAPMVLEHPKPTPACWKYLSIRAVG